MTATLENILSGKTIVFVDDNPDNQMIMGTYVTAKGGTFKGFTRPEECIAYIVTNEIDANDPNTLYVTDNAMPSPLYASKEISRAHELVGFLREYGVPATHICVNTSDPDTVQRNIRPDDFVDVRVLKRTGSPYDVIKDAYFRAA